MLRNTFNVIITGRNGRVVSDVYDHLKAKQDYRLFRSQPNYKDIFKIMCSEDIHAAVICLQEESAENIELYDMFADYGLLKNLRIIVIGTEIECERFKSFTSLLEISFHIRPINIFALIDRLDQYKENVFSETKFSDSDRFFDDYTNKDSPATRKRKHILVVDDDVQVLVQIKLLLQEFYDVTSVPSGRYAYAYLEKHMVDLILLDYIMPEENGPSVLKNLRANERTANIPIVFLTGVSETDMVRKTLLELRPQGYLLKPAKKIEIVSKIIEILG